MSALNQTKSRPDIYLPVPATLIGRQVLTAQKTFFEFRLDSGRSLGHRPGQFVGVSLAGIGEAPISVSSAPCGKDTFELVVRRVGNVTEAMHRLQVGAKVGIRGPFGTSFPVDGAMLGRDLIFICGGIGLVPVRSAILHVLNNRPNYGKLSILIGTRSPAERLFTGEIETWRKAPNVECLETVDSADQEWKGNVGVVTNLIPSLDIDWGSALALVCGPPVMYKFVILELNRMGMTNDAIYLSLERHMKCGVGKCGHCQVNHLYMCQDGPVIRYSDIAAVWEAL